MKLPKLSRGLNLVLALATGFMLHAEEPRVIADLKLTLAPIPAGTFTMGSPKNEPGRSQREGPQTNVTISQPFWLGQTEVTHAQWRAVMGTDLVMQAREMLDDDTLYDIAGKLQTLRDYYKEAKNSDPNDLVYNGGDDAPMYWVNWQEAVTFCRRLTEREGAAGRLPSGYVFRLPTEAEWEYACRAGTTDATYAGAMEIKGRANAPVLDRIAWYAGNSSEGYVGMGANTSDWREKQYPGGTAAQRAVGTKRPNNWGLFDMLGNVWEWCGDWDADKLPGGTVRDPTGPVSGTQRVFRGGSWGNPPAVCRAAARTSFPPNMRLNGIGFRLALAPKLSAP